MTSLDRFQGYDSVPEPNIIGDCIVCGFDVYDYDESHCQTCGGLIHFNCLASCAVCEHSGCYGCLIPDDDSGNYYCGEICMGIDGKET
jgi:hypothetical protein